MNSLLRRAGAFLAEDFAAKIFILFFSAFLWYFVNVLALDKTTVNLPVQVDNLPENFVVVPIDRLNVQVNLRSRQDMTEQMENIRAFVDLQRAKDGESFYKVRLEGVPEGVFSSVLPYTLRLDVDTLAEKEMPLTLKTSGADAKNYLAGYRFAKETIKVWGPSRQLKKIRRIESEPLNLKQFSSARVSASAELKPPPYLRLENSSMPVELTLILDLSTNVVEVPIQITNFPEDAWLDSEPTARAIIASRNPEGLKTRVKATADAGLITRPGKHMLPVTIETKDSLISNLTPEIEIEILR